MAGRRRGGARASSCQSSMTSCAASLGDAWPASGWVIACKRRRWCNEAYLRLLDVQQVNWQNRAHFLAMSARLMRRILVDFARSKEVSEARRGSREGDIR